MDKIDKDWWVAHKEIEMYKKKLRDLEDIKSYGGYKITFTKSNRGTAHPAEVEIVATTAYPDMDIAHSVISQTIAIYKARIEFLYKTLNAI